MLLNAGVNYSKRSYYVWIIGMLYSSRGGDKKTSEAIRFISRGFFLGIIFHFAQIALSGWNGDSLGFGPYYSTYLGELAQGRYGLLLFSRRIVNPAIEFIGSIMLYSSASLLVLNLIGIEINSLYAMLVQAIFMSQPHIATYSSFSYASFPYTLAYFLIILAVWLVITAVKAGEKDKRKKALIVIASIVAVMFSFSIWQGYIPTFSTLVFILLLLGKDNRERLHTILTAIVVAIGGTGLYVIGMKIVNYV